MFTNLSLFQSGNEVKQQRALFNEAYVETAGYMHSAKISQTYAEKNVTQVAPSSDESGRINEVELKQQSFTKNLASIDAEDRVFFTQESDGLNFAKVNAGYLDSESEYFAFKVPPVADADDPDGQTEKA